MKDSKRMSGAQAQKTFEMKAQTVDRAVPPSPEESQPFLSNAPVLNSLNFLSQALSQLEAVLDDHAYRLAPVLYSAGVEAGTDKKEMKRAGSPICARLDDEVDRVYRITSTLRALTECLEI